MDSPLTKNGTWGSILTPPLRWQGLPILCESTCKVGEDTSCADGLRNLQSIKEKPIEDLLLGFDFWKHLAFHHQWLRFPQLSVCFALFGLQCNRGHSAFPKPTQSLCIFLQCGCVQRWAVPGPQYPNQRTSQPAKHPINLSFPQIATSMHQCCASNAGCESVLFVSTGTTCCSTSHSSTGLWNRWMSRKTPTNGRRRRGSTRHPQHLQVLVKLTREFLSLRHLKDRIHWHRPKVHSWFIINFRPVAACFTSLYALAAQRLTHSSSQWSWQICVWRWTCIRVGTWRRLKYNYPLF